MTMRIFKWTLESRSHVAGKPSGWSGEQSSRWQNEKRSAISCLLHKQPRMKRWLLFEPLLHRGLSVYPGGSNTIVFCFVIMYWFQE